MTAAALTLIAIGLLAARISAALLRQWLTECDAHTAAYFRRQDFAQAQRRITHGGRK